MREVGKRSLIGTGGRTRAERPKLVVYLVAPGDYPTATFRQPFVCPFAPCEGSNEGFPELERTRLPRDASPPLPTTSMARKRASAAALAASAPGNEARLYTLYLMYIAK